MQTFSNTFHEAKLWLDSGIATIPIIAHSKKPAISWKQYQTELPSIVDLIRWFRKPGYNLGVVCGWRDLTVLDFDKLIAYQEFVNQYPQFRNTYRGMHVYTFCQNAKTQMSKDLDIKSSGYCIAQPGSHFAGWRTAAFEYKFAG